MDQKTFFHQAGVSINTSRFIVNGQIIPIADIASAQLHVIKPKHGLDVLFMLVGLLLLLDEGSLFVVGGLLCLIGILLWLSAKESYAILLVIASDQRQVMQSSDRLLITQVMQALDHALQYHGESTYDNSAHRDTIELREATGTEGLVIK